MPFRSWLCLCALAMGGQAVAGDLVVRVDDRGQPVADAVVAVRPATDVASGAGTPLPAVAAIDQRDLAFVPFVQLARPGGVAVFRNSDHTRHHVYSFSPAATFEMVLAPGEQSARVPLRREGVVAVGCNIHDQMISWLYVSDAPWLARTDGDGRVRFDAMPPGEYRVMVWHPRLEGDREAVHRRIDLASGPGTRTLDVALRLRAGARSGPDPERVDY